VEAGVRINGPAWAGLDFVAAQMNRPIDHELGIGCSGDGDLGFTLDISPWMKNQLAGLDYYQVRY
jgi:hypothetical protein